MYAITGATGNTGKAITLSLLSNGKKVRAIVRNAEKAQELADAGAEVYAGDLANKDFLISAFDGVDVVYALLPPNMQAPDFTEYQKTLSDSLAYAIEKCEVKYVVALSSVGAHMSSGNGVIRGLRYMEDRFSAIPGLNFLALRPSYFMENTLGQAGVVKAMGVMGSPVKGDMRIPMVATKDIAAYAAKRLLALDFSGYKVQYLLGSRDVSYNEVATVYGNTIGKPDLKYIEFPYEAFHATMVNDWYASKHVADMFIEFIRAANEGDIMADAVRDFESTTPTSIEDFSGTFAYVYNM